MDRVRLGRTDLEVSVACLGAGGRSCLGKRTGATFDESVAVVRAALDHGINFIDTAESYGTESIVGAGVAGRRDEVIISTKNQAVRLGTPIDGDEYVSAAEFTAYVDASLERLGTEYVDIMQIHAPAPHQYDYCMAEIVPAMRDLQTAGKIRFLGLTERFNLDPRHTVLTSALADDAFDVMMVGFNMVNQGALRHVLPEATRHDVGILAMFAVRGKLADPSTARALVDEVIAKGEVDPDDFEEADPLGFLTEPGAARSMTAACYRFVRHTPGVDVTLTGTGSIDHLIDNIAALDEPPLPDATVERLARLFGRVETITGE